MKGLKLKGWTAQPPPEPDKAEAVRNIAIQVIYAKYNTTKKVSTLAETAEKVKTIIKEKIENGSWPKTWGMVGKRFIDRRVNEAAEPTWFKDGVPRLAAKSAGFYQPNPVRFMELTT